MLFLAHQKYNIWISISEFILYSLTYSSDHCSRKHSRAGEFPEAVRCVVSFQTQAHLWCILNNLKNKSESQTGLKRFNSLCSNSNVRHLNFKKCHCPEFGSDHDSLLCDSCTYWSKPFMGIGHFDAKAVCMTQRKPFSALSKYVDTVCYIKVLSSSPMCEITPKKQQCETCGLVI